MSGADQFEAFVRRFQDMVFATAVRLVGSRSDAEDISQGVFLRAFQRFDELRDQPAAAGWLKTTTRNACLNHLSRYRRRWTFFSEIAGTEGEQEPGFDPVDSAGTSPLLQVERAEDLARLERALALLPDAQRVALVLFHFEALSYHDIAAALGVSLGKVKTDIFRGRYALRKVLGDAP